MLGFAPLATAPLASNATAAALPALTATATAAFAVTGAADAQSHVAAQATPGITFTGEGQGSAVAFGAVSDAGAAALAITATGLGAAITTGICAAQLVLSGQAVTHSTTYAASDGKLGLARGATSSVEIAASAQGRQLPLGLESKATLGLTARLQGAMPVGLALRGESHGGARTVISLELMAQGQAAARLDGHVASESSLAGSVHASGTIACEGQLPLDPCGAAVAHSMSAASAKIGVSATGLAWGATHAQALAAGAVSVQRGVDGLAAVMANARPALALGVQGQGLVSTRVLSLAAIKFLESGAGQVAIAARGQVGIGAGIGIAGRILASSRAPSLAVAAGAVSLAGAAHLQLLTHARLLRSAELTGLVRAELSSTGQLRGQLPLSSVGLAAATLLTRAGRSVPLEGTSAARSITHLQTAESRLVLHGEAQGITARGGVGRSGFGLMVQAQGAASLAAKSHLHLPHDGTSHGVTDARGAARTALQIAADGQVRSTLLGWATTGLHIHGVGQAKTVIMGLAWEEIELAGRSGGRLVTAGTARGTVAVARAFTGDVDVLGDSSRQISIGIAAAIWVASTVQTSESVVEIKGQAKAQASAGAQATHNMALLGSATLGARNAVTTSGSIGWITQASAAAPRSAQSQGALSLVGKGQARSAVDATARIADLTIGGELAGATGLTAGLSADAVLDGAAAGSFAISGQGAGLFTVARDSDADVQVAGAAARALPLTGAAAGAIVARTTRAGWSVALGGIATARVRAAADSARGAAMAVQGHATGAARAQAISMGHVAFVRLSLGDVLVEGGAAPGMALLGSAQAGNVTRAAANLPLAPKLASNATNVIRVEFAAREVGVAARGIAQASVFGIATEPDLDLGLAFRAVGAPPALRRSEPPRTGLSGRLLPTNSGRILRG
jgi:hypothetical protein